MMERYFNKVYLNVTMKKESILASLLSVSMLSIVIVAAVWFFIYQKFWIGPVFLLLGMLHLIVLKMFGKYLRTLWPDIVFGIIDNGILVAGALVGAGFAGAIGAIVGGSAANAVTDGFAGIFEGWTAEYLRKHKISERRTALSASIGKMAGCFIGAGIVLVIVWTIMNL